MIRALANFKVNKYDRAYQFWKREPLSVGLITPAVFYQKLEYIHYNPVTAGLCEIPEEYYYSSAKFYLDGTDNLNLNTFFRKLKEELTFVKIILAGCK